MSNRIQFRRYDVGYQPTKNLVTQPPDKGSNMLPILTTDLSRAYQELEEKVSILSKLSGLTLDDFIERLAAGFTLVPPKKQNTNLDDLVKKTADTGNLIDNSAAFLRWIPVEERMPDLITIRNLVLGEAVTVLTSGQKVITALWDGSKWIGDFKFWKAEDEEVTHWTPILLPLPEPPEVEV